MDDKFCPLSRTEKAAIVLAAFSLGLMVTLLVLDNYGVFS